MTNKNNSLRGEITRDAPLGAESWFGCGGRADLLFEPADADDLQDFLAGRPQDDILVLGGLANTIIRDGGIRGCVIRLGKPFSDVRVLDDIYIQAGSGTLNGSVAAAAVRAGIGGLEFLSGVPGTVGGALAMNAGAYGSEVADILIGAYAVNRQGEIKRLIPSSRRRPGSSELSEEDPGFRRGDGEEMHMSYRHTDIPPGAIFTGAVFKGKKEDYETVKTRMNAIKAKRNETQPIREKTGGSTFANPHPEALRLAGLPEDMRAWQVVERVGGRGLRMGGAQMSEMHCNFMINTGDATAADLENLGDEIRKRALHDLGLDLKWEIKRVGERSD